MEETNSELLSLPRRAYNQPVKFSQRDQKYCITNYYAIDLGAKHKHIYQFTFECEPALPQDSKDLLRAVVRSFRKQVSDKIEGLIDSGNMLWGLKPLTIPLNVKCEFMFEETSYKFDVLIKQTKTLDMADLMQSPNGQTMAYQIFNSRIKQVLRERGMDELYRGKYFDQKEIIVKRVGLSIIRGFNFTLCSLKSGLFL